MRALSIAATGMDAQQKRVEVISNNLANMNTTAYNTRRAEFADLHYQIARAAGSSSSATGDVVPEGVQLGMGVRFDRLDDEQRKRVDELYEQAVHRAVGLGGE